MNKKKPIDQQLRNIVIKLAINEGKPKREIAKMLKISEGSVRFICKKFQETGIVESQKRGGAKPSGLDEEKESRINSLMEDNKIYTVEEIKNQLNLNQSISTVWRWLKKLNYTYKVVRTIPELRNSPEVKIERMNYVTWYLNLPIHVRYRNVIFIDESPFNLHMVRKHGFSIRGSTPNLHVKSSKGPNITMILAINCINIIHSEAIIGVGVNQQIFQTFLQKIHRILGNEEYILVMDNVRFHHSNSEFLDSYPYQIKYLPRYSPFLNPCEEAFSKIKNIVRGPTAPVGTDDLIQRMMNGCNSITSDNLSGYFNHSESFFPKCTSNEDIERE